MTVIRPNSISGITSLTAHRGSIDFYAHDGSAARFDNINSNVTSGVSTFASLNITGDIDVGGALTYEDVTNIDSVGVITARAGVKIPDSQKIFLGDDSDLQIYHDGANSHVSDQGTGDLRLSGNVVKFNNQSNTATMVKATQGGSVELNYDNSKKLETTSDGIDVNGTIQSSGPSFSGLLKLGEGSSFRGEVSYSYNGGNDKELKLNSHGSGGVITLRTNGTERLRVNSAGDVLFDTTNTNPTANNADGTAILSGGGIRLSRDGEPLGLNRGGSDGVFIDMRRDGTSKATMGVTSNALQFSTAGTERLRIQPSGYIGIGDAAPGGKLTVKHANTATSGLNATLKLKQGVATNGNRSSLIFSSLDDYDVAAVNGVVEVHSGTSANNVGRLEFWTKASGSNAAERVRISSAGDATFRHKVNIGELYGGGEILSVGKSSGTGYMAFHSGGANMGFIGYADQLITGGASNELGIRSQDDILFSSGGATERLRITSAGKVQITGTRGGTLQPSDNDSLELYTSATSGNVSTGGGITFYNHHGGGHVMGGVIHVVKANGVYENSSSDMLFGTRISGSSVAYRARLTSMGEWQTFSTSINIDISNTQSAGNNEAFIYARNGSTSMTAGTLAFRVYTNGNVSNTNNSYGSISDQNLKENIVDATSQWNDIKALQVRKYNFRQDTGHQTHTQLGLIAQEVETVSPGLVETTAVREGETCQDADGNQLESIKSINYSVLYMKAVKALQEAQTRIETLETQVTDALARIAALEG